MKPAISMFFTWFTLLFTAASLYAQNLESVFVKGDHLLYQDYQVSKSFDPPSEEWSVTLKKDGKILSTFSKGGNQKEWSNFGLFSFLGEATPQLVVEQYSGGAHCCYSSWIINLYPDFRVLHDSQAYPVNSPIILLDLDKDGRFEFSQTISHFDYFDGLCHACSPFPLAVFQYEPRAKKFLPANKKFSPYLLEGMERNIKNVKEFNARTDFAQYKDDIREHLTLVLVVVLNYIYAGKEAAGWDFFDKEYRLKDKEEMRVKIKKKLKEDAVYRYIYGLK